MKNFIIDAHGILIRYLFAVPETFSTTGINVNGILAFCRFLHNLIDNNQGCNIFIAFDKCRNNFRKQIFSNYKANRKTLDKNISEQINLAIQLCELMNIPFEYHDEYEADDIIASFVKQNSDKKFEIIAVDKDLYQLVNSNVIIYNPFKKINITEQFIIDNFGIKASQFWLLLSLCGDSADNIPGIRGIGPKTAIKMIQNNFNLDEIIQNNSDKFDFSEINKMISLVKLYENINLKNFNFNPRDNQKSIELSLFLKEIGYIN